MPPRLSSVRVERWARVAELTDPPEPAQQERQPAQQEQSERPLGARRSL
jgi:hypothetical protein